MAEEQLEEAIAKGRSPNELIVMKNELSRRIGIYSMVNPSADRIPATGWRDFPVDEYLAAVEGCTTT